MRDYLFMALRRLKTRLFESVVIIIAIGLGTGVIAAALALRFFFMDYAQRITGDEFNRTIHVRSGEEYSFQEAVIRVGEKIIEPASINLQTLYDVRENCPDVAYTILARGTSLQLREMDGAPMDLPPTNHEEFLKWQERQEENYLQLRLSTEDEFRVRDMPLKMGSSFTKQDVLLGNRVLVLGEDAAQRLFPDRNPVGETLSPVNQESFTIIGVLKRLTPADMTQTHRVEEVNRGGIIPVTANQWEMQRNTDPLEIDIHSFMAIVDTVEKLSEAEGQIQSYLRERLGEGFTIQSPLSWQRELQPTISRGQIIAAFAASLGLLIAAINILNLMLARVLKRTKEIGVLSALGTTRRIIFHLFLWEALVLGFFGALLGFGLALIGEQVMASIIDGFIPRVDIRVFLFSMGIAGFISLLFGIYPALQASRINPMDALRTD